MTTTPTWSGVITYDQNVLQSFSTPKVTALSDDSFAIVWEDGTDLFGRHFDEKGQLTSGNFLGALSSAQTKAISNPQIFEQVDGRVVVEFELLFGAGDGDIIWHSAAFDNSTSNQFNIENSGFDEFLENAIARPAGQTLSSGSAISYIYAGAGGSFLVMRLVDSLGNQASNQIFVGVHSGEQQFRSQMDAFDLGNVAIVYENFVNATSARQIRMHIYDPDDSSDVSGEVNVSANNVNASFPDIAILGHGLQFSAVTWQQDGGIAYRMFLGGVAASAVLLIPDSAGGLLPKITALNDGGFMILWGQAFGTESDASSDFDLVVQRFDASGNTVGNKVFVDEPGDQGPFATSIDTLDDGRVVVTFQNETGNATGLTTLDYFILDPRETTISGGSAADTIVGRLEASTINGLGGTDHLIGMNLNDILDGGDGDDTLTGGRGKDKLTGGLNDDTFDFNSVNESKRGAADVIKDFGTGSDIDLIDLEDIDAKKGGADNKFKFIGTQDFHHRAGELHYVKLNKPGHDHDRTIVEGDINGDGRADLQIILTGLHNLKGHDFIL
jgi:Ca2+-binding RTX toxin-like protein